MNLKQKAFFALVLAAVTVSIIANAVMYRPAAEALADPSPSGKTYDVRVDLSSNVFYRTCLRFSEDGRLIDDSLGGGTWQLLQARLHYVTWQAQIQSELLSLDVRMGITSGAGGESLVAAGEGSDGSVTARISGTLNPACAYSLQDPGSDTWRKLGYDLASSFHNPDESAIAPSNVSQLRRAWLFRTFDSINGTPAVIGGRVYVLSRSGTYALDAATGGVIWWNSLLRGTSSPTYSDGILYVTGLGGSLHALDARTGLEIWRAMLDPHPLAAGFSSPVVVGEYVVVGSSSTEVRTAKTEATFHGSVVAFDRATGNELWRYYTAEPSYNGVSVWSSPSVDTETGVVFATTGQNYTGEAGPTSDAIVALELATGRLLWKRQLTEGDVFTFRHPRQGFDYDFGTNPILFEWEIDGQTRKLLGAGQKSGMFWVLDRETGEIVWSRQVSNGSHLVGGVFNNGAFDGERIIVAGNNGTSNGAGSEPANGQSQPYGDATIPTSVLMALNPGDGSVLWERQLPAWVWAPISIANGVGFVAIENELQAFDVATGAKLFTYRTDGTIASGPAVAAGRVFFGSGVFWITTEHDNKLHALTLP